MSEFKFACPVCGQHITADSDAAGTQIECPTCFQKIVVPQGPTSGDSKFILSATQVGKARPISTPAVGATQVSRPNYIPVLIPILLVLALGALAFVFRAKLFRSAAKDAAQTVVQTTSAPARPRPKVFHPIPTNIVWTLNLADAVIPESTVAGSLRGKGFLCERAILTGGNLMLRQGTGPVADLAVNMQLFAKTGEELSGKTIEIAPEREPPEPKVILRWRDEAGKGKSKSFPTGYLLRLVFGQPNGGKMPGKVFLALPDQDHSVLAGTFLAEIRKPAPPKPPKQPGRPKAPPKSPTP